jgi:hypothetical protein
LDGELSPEEEKNILRHVRVCKKCSEEYRDLKNLEYSMKKVQLPDFPDAVWDEHWSQVYNRLERGVGYILLSLGVMFLMGYVLFWAVDCWFCDASVPIIVRLGVGLGCLGVVVLVVSTVREKILMRRYDQYKELQR